MSVTSSRPTLEQRFWEKVERGESCWLWTAATNNVGYGVFGVTPRQARLAHRVAYEFVVGPIPDGRELHHVCGVPRCVRPEHLQPVTRKEHVALSPNHSANLAACRRDHPFTPENTYRTPDGHRRCRECVRIRDRLRYKPGIGRIRVADI